MNEYIKLDILESFPNAFDFEFFNNHVTCKIPKNDSHIFLGVTYIPDKEIFRVVLEGFYIVPTNDLVETLKFLSDSLTEVKIRR